MRTVLKSLGWAVLLGAAGRVGARAAEPKIWKVDSPARVGGASPVVWGNPRVVDGAVVFDGRADGLVVPDNPLAGWKQFTVEILFCPGEGGEPAQRFFHAEEAVDAAQARRALIEARFDGAGGWWLDTFLRTARDKRTLIDPRRVHPTGKWYWAALRYDGKTMAHFVNGEKEAEGAVEFGAMGAGKTSLGVRQNRLYWFKGAIREVRFAPVAVPEGELQRVE